MAVTSTDIKWFKAANASGDADTLGNRKGYTEIVSAVMNNLFPNVTQAERTSIGGITRYRKFFIQNRNTDETSFENVKVWLDFDSTGGDFFRIAPGTYIDTKADSKNYKGGEQWTIGAVTGSVSVGETVTGGTSGAQCIVEAISSGNYAILRNISSPLTAANAIQAETFTGGSGSFATSGTALEKIAFVGNGIITQAITSGDDTIYVNFGSTTSEHDIRGRLVPGDVLVITNLEDVSDVTHAMEFIVVGEVTWSGSTAEILIADGNTVMYDYAVSYTGVSSKAGQTIYTRVCQVIDCGNLDATVSNLVKVSSNGNLTLASVIAHNKGAITDTITITIGTAGSFTVVGTSGTSYTAGSVLSDYHPTNPNTSSYYFTIPTAAWSGSFAEGDTFTFDITEAAQGIWAKEIVPQDTASTSRNSTWFALCGESA